MRIVGITYPTEDGTLQTILVPSSISLLDATVRAILPWFFNHTVPLLGVLAKSSVAVRIQTNTDPFRLLRDPKSTAPFDGKGFTLQRNVRHGGFVRIDDGINISIEDFNRLCPGLFYGTAKYPSLNILLSLRRFRKYVMHPSHLWSIMYDCLLCRQFNERQQTDGYFKFELRQLFYTTQLQDFRPQIAELQERIELSKQYSKLKNSLQQMLNHVHSEQVHRYKNEMNQLNLMLRNVSIEKRQLIDTRSIQDLNTTMLMDREIAAANIMVKQGELQNLLSLCQAELHQAKTSLEVQTGFEANLKELKENITVIENILKEVNSIEFLELEVENARCAIENNQSLMMLLKIGNKYERKIYISNLQTHKQSMKNSLRFTLEDVNRDKSKLESIVDQMHKLKDLCSVSTTNDDECDALIGQLQNTMVDIVETTNEIIARENETSHLQQQIWHSYLEDIPSIPFTELLAIAAVTMAIELSANAVKEDFMGFVYERALDTGIQARWREGLSCSAIFRSNSSVAHVKRLIEQEQIFKESFPYFVLETRVRSSLNNFLFQNIPAEDGDACSNYEQTVEKVNTVVERLVAQLRTNRKLTEARECLENLIAAKDLVLTDLDALRNCSYIQWPRIKMQDLPNLVDRYITAKSYKVRRQASYEALDKFITQIASEVVPLPNANQLKEAESRLKEELETLLQTVAQKKTIYYNCLKQLASKCDTMQFTLERFFFDEDRSPMSEGLSAAVYRKLIACWESCSESIMRAISTTEQMANNIVPPDAAPPGEIDELIEQIQALNLREKSLATRIACAENILEDYQRERGCASEYNALSHYTQPHQRAAQDISKMMDKIVATQLQLQQLPPGCSTERINLFKSKLKYLTFLEREQSNARDMCFNNLILPIIDKVLVQKLRLMCQLVSSVSEDLPELGGIVKVSFEYETLGPEGDDAHNDQSQTSFSLHRIQSVNIQIFDDDNVEVSINETRRHLVYLILFLSFLSCDDCKFVVLDKACEQLFENGTISLFYVLEKHFPTMQFILL